MIMLNQVLYLRRINVIVIIPHWSCFVVYMSLPYCVILQMLLKELGSTTWVGWVLCFWKWVIFTNLELPNSLGIAL